MIRSITRPVRQAPDGGFFYRPARARPGQGEIRR